MSYHVDVIRNRNSPPAVLFRQAWREGKRSDRELEPRRDRGPPLSRRSLETPGRKDRDRRLLRDGDRCCADDQVGRMQAATVVLYDELDLLDSRDGKLGNCGPDGCPNTIVIVSLAGVGGRPRHLTTATCWAPTGCWRPPRRLCGRANQVAKALGASRFGHVPGIVRHPGAPRRKQSEVVANDRCGCSHHVGHRKPWTYKSCSRSLKTAPAAGARGLCPCRAAGLDAPAAARSRTARQRRNSGGARAGRIGAGGAQLPA